MHVVVMLYRLIWLVQLMLCNCTVKCVIVLRDKVCLQGNISLRTHVSCPTENYLLLWKYPFFLLSLIINICSFPGTSDPYVKFKIGGKQLYKSRIIHKNLNPRWDERFSLPVEDINKPISVKVFDYDRGLNDDPMGGSEILPKSLEINRYVEVVDMIIEASDWNYNKQTVIWSHKSVFPADVTKNWISLNLLNILK